MILSSAHVRIGQTGLGSENVRSGAPSRRGGERGLTQKGEQELVDRRRRAKERPAWAVTLCKNKLTDSEVLIRVPRLATSDLASGRVFQLNRPGNRRESLMRLVDRTLVDILPAFRFPVGAEANPSLTTV